MLLNNLKASYLQIMHTFLRFIYIFIPAFIIKRKYFIIIIINLYLLILKYKLIAPKTFNTFLTLTI
jgi:predicted tellurium resistance membrane protein TerC